MTTKTDNAIHSAGLLLRYAAITADSINADQRTVRLSVSSETPIERWFGYEILDHRTTSVRLERIRAGGPVLLDHYSDQIGVVELCDVEGGRLVATLRFGNSAKAQEVWADIRDGIRRNVSIGYRVRTMVLIEGGDTETYRAMDWEPYEISIVSTPADITVGVGREAAYAHDITIKRDNTMPTSEKNTTTPVVVAAHPATATPTTQQVDTTSTRSAGNQPPADREELIRSVRETERTRIRELEVLGSQFQRYDGVPLARQMIQDGRGVEDFRRAILDKIPKMDQAGSGGMPASAIDLPRRERENYSLMRAINAAYNGDWSKAGLELECSTAVAQQVGRDARGFFVPYDVLSHRVMSTGVASGGTLVATEYRPDEFIQRLRNETLVSRLGARYLSGLTGNPDIPGGATGATFYWLGEDENVTNSDITFRSVGLSPKTVAGAVAMTRRLMLQSSPDIEALVTDDLLKGMALAIDTAVLKGTGANNQPTGILNQAGVLTVTLATAGEPTRQELRAFKTAMKKSNSFIGSPVYVTTPDIEAYLEDEPTDTGSGRFLLESGRALGIGVESTNLLDANTLLLGNFADVIIGLWGVLDLMPDKAAKAASGGLVLRVFQDVDVAIRHPQSFVKAA